MEMINDELRLKIIESAKRLSQVKGISKITVRDILKDLNITNRVFYNRFHNIDEVLDIIYTETINKVRESLSIPWNDHTDFEQHIQTVAERTLILTYDSRQNMSQYIFEADSFANENFKWWTKEIEKLIITGKELHFLKADIHENAMSYSLWCYIRGFNADALARNLSIDEALELFRYGFNCFINGMKD